MIKNKKGQGMSLSTIIIAILCLLVLVILALVFSGFFGKWGIEVGTLFQGKEDCGTLNGQQVASGQDPACPGTTTPYLGIVKDLPKGYICCVEPKK